MTLVPLASPLVAPCSALVWSACFAMLQLTGIARRGVHSGKKSPSGEPTPLRRRDQLMWDARLVSTLHAIVLIVGEGTNVNPIPPFDRDKAIVHSYTSRILRVSLPTFQSNDRIITLRYMAR